ncbi:MAG: hypothetical protein WBO57_06605 [Gammaproteobacteria bacterium]
MKKGKQTLRKPDPLLLLTVLVALGVLFTTGVGAGERFSLTSLDFADMLDGDVTMARIGASGAGLHLSVESEPGMEHVHPVSQISGREQNKTASVFLSVRMPW